ncbi:39S ribosomal protein L1, mitochondrial isoform X19 [Serinus canaria]|uniref:39S ribosomal protein L1, mitochondrial isoform X18 n=1 Tax=Serinus canaria TaxID=9135 RepID=UPI0021CC5B45|nr:39S ribosomal protein L1, mitochondrial isoform X18 [Serinus canaria]XP_050829931.1 39S ribosomal protein L1, mitochondrial isoform X19 [Serinus canaria]
MAAPSARCLWRALAPRCGWVLPGLEQRLAVPAVVSPATARPYAAAAAKAAKKDAKRSRHEKGKEHKEKPLPRRRPLMSKPVDDVYLTWLYRRPSYGLEQAVGMLKRFQELDFTHPKQFVYINVFLDMALHKKKKVDPFSSGVALPHRFTDEVNKVLVFTEVGEPQFLHFHGVLVLTEVGEPQFPHFHGVLVLTEVGEPEFLHFHGVLVLTEVGEPEFLRFHGVLVLTEVGEPQFLGFHGVLVFTENEQEAEAAREHGAAIVGGVELIKWILEDEIQADFYVAVPAIIPKLIPLRNKLRKKYPSTKRNSLGSDIPRMVQFFRECHEYSVEDESVIKTRIARLDMPTEHIIANLKAIVQDICTFKPSNFDPIVQRLVIRSSTSEGLLLNLDGILPQVERAEEKEQGDAADEDQQKPAQESVST